MTKKYSISLIDAFKTNLLIIGTAKYTPKISQKYQYWENILNENPLSVNNDKINEMIK